MDTPTLNDELDNTYVVGFQGRLVHCSTIKDALAIKRAGAVLAGGYVEETPEQLCRLVGVLRQYSL
jgi:hypothetical protein